MERDFVEAPSQMFENWVWNADVLKTFARHYKTKEPFPKAMLDGMLAARYLGSGIVKGIGEAYAKRIVAAFGMETLRVLDETPHAATALLIGFGWAIGASMQIASGIIARTRTEMSTR